MKEFEVEVETPDGRMPTFIAQPDGAGPFAPVILYMDVPGIREELRNFARRIAGEGYCCLLPDLYYRDGRVRFDLAKGQGELKRMFAAGSKLSNAMILRDTRGLLDYIAGEESLGARVGVIGYCMSGQFVVAAAGTFPEQISAAASLYGVRIVTEEADSPHLLADRIQGELYLGFAEEDPYVPDSVIPILKSSLDRAGVVYQLDIHPGTEHGFCFPERPSYAQEAAEQVWNLVFDLYRRKLRT